MCNLVFGIGLWLCMFEVCLVGAQLIPGDQRVQLVNNGYEGIVIAIAESRDQDNTVITKIKVGYR